MMGWPVAKDEKNEMASTLESGEEVTAKICQCVAFHDNDDNDDSKWFYLYLMSVLYPKTIHVLQSYEGSYRCYM